MIKTRDFGNQRRRPILRLSSAMVSWGHELVALPFELAMFLGTGYFCFIVALVGGYLPLRSQDFFRAAIVFAPLVAIAGGWVARLFVMWLMGQ